MISYPLLKTSQQDLASKCEMPRRLLTDRLLGSTLVSGTPAASDKDFKLSTDKQFVEKLTDVVGLYMNPSISLVIGGA